MMALVGVRVLDLSKLLPGGYCGMLLADLGAEVIKVEDPAGGDPVRYFQPQREGMSYWHLALNRNKKSMTLDLRSSEGRQVLLELVKEADVLLESFRPGLMAKLGLSFEELAKVNPRLIYCSISGLGGDEEAPAHDINIAGLAGIDPSEYYQEQRIPLTGIAGATHGALGIVSALYQRTVSGKGQKVDISLLRSAFALKVPEFSNLLGEKETGVPLYPAVMPNYRTYRTKDDRYIAVGTFEEKFWNRLCELIDFPEGKEKMTNPSKREELTRKMEDIFAEKSLDEWNQLLGSAGICVTPVQTLAEAMENNTMAECGMMIELSDEKIGNYFQIGSPIHFSEAPSKIPLRAPFLGEHNEEFLGFESERLQK